VFQKRVMAAESGGEAKEGESLVQGQLGLKIKQKK
jgi:hypothetical protein